MQTGSKPGCYKRLRKGCRSRSLYIEKYLNYSLMNKFSNFKYACLSKILTGTNSQDIKKNVTDSE